MIDKIFRKLINLNKTRVPEKSNASNLQSNVKDQSKRILESMDRDRKLSAVPCAFKLLIDNDEETKLKVAESLNVFVNSINVGQLMKIDKMFRLNNAYDWTYDWRSKRPEEFLHPLMSESEKVTILGLSSFHPNGYLREKAVKGLCKTRTGDEIPYLLIRINDWVGEVRNLSKESFLKRINPKNAKNLVNNLPLVFRLKDCSRDEYDDIIDAVVSMLSSNECSSVLMDGLNSNDAKVRLCCYKIIIQTRTLDNKNMINHLIKEKNSFVRLFVLRKVQETMTCDEFRDISQFLLKDNLAQIRMIALEALHSFNLQGSIPALENGLFDRSPCVRELSRYLLRKHDDYDFASVYRNAIDEKEEMYGAICGLGETGSAEDAKYIVDFLDSDSIRIVKSAMNSVARLSLEEYKKTLISFLNDWRPGVSKTSRRILYKEIDSMDAENIHDIFKQTEYDHARINACILLCSLGKWDSINYILEACDNSNDEISNIGQCELEKWKLKFNHSYNKPTQKQIARIKSSIKRFENAIKDSNREYIEFAIKDFL